MWIAQAGRRGGARRTSCAVTSRLSCEGRIRGVPTRVPTPDGPGRRPIDLQWPVRLLGTDITAIGPVLLAASGNWATLARVVVGGLLVAGLVLFLSGFIGRLPTDRPRCRRCGHDLRSFGDVAKACPGCGAALDVARAVAFGPRRRSRRAMLVGAGLLGLAWVGALSWRSIESRGAVVAPPPPAPARSGRALLTFSKPIDALAQPELIGARTLPVRDGGAIEVVLATAAPARGLRLGAASIEVGGHRVPGQVRTVAEADAAGRSVLVVVVDFPGFAGVGAAEGRADGARPDASAILRGASRLELIVVAEDGATASWGYRDPFAGQTKDVVEGEAGP